MNGNVINAKWRGARHTNEGIATAVDVVVAAIDSELSATQLTLAGVMQEILDLDARKSLLLSQSDKLAGEVQGLIALRVRVLGEKIEENSCAV